MGRFNADFTYLYETYGPMVYRYIFSKLPNHDSTQDIIQETFKDLFYLKPELVSEEHARSWLIRVSSHKLVDFVRKEKAQHCVYVDDLEGILYSGSAGTAKLSYDNVAEWVEFTAEQERIDYAWRKLHDKDRDKYKLLLELTYSGLSVAEIARKHQISENNCSKMLSRARKYMAKAMDSYKD